ncbi:MAG: NAD(P)/FAD-dependent oxidoreductase [Chloroflexi bacterium OHK40]
MNVAIVGAGVAGLAAAYDLAGAGHRVTIYEAAPVVGGLASGFRDAAWSWPLERFYHHIFQTDQAIIALTHEIGFGDRLFFRSPITAQWWQGQGRPIFGDLPALRLPGGRSLRAPGLLGTAIQTLNYPGLSLPSRLRMGLVAAYLKFVVRDWRPLERETAAVWTRRTMGEPVYQAFVRPLLEGKFGPHTDEVNMAWLWARLKARSFKLGYFEGGFQGFSDALRVAVERRGAQVRLSSPVERAVQQDDGWELVAGGSTERYDQLLVTGAPGLLAKLAPQLPEHYLGRLRKLHSMGAVVLTLALRRPLTRGLYWVNMPKDQFPFLALVEHTNFIGPEHYGGDHLIYLGDYLEQGHAYFSLSHEELLARFLPSLSLVNPAFEPGWVRTSWLHREPYAQPIVPVGHSASIPPLRTPLPGLFWASMSQVYPWDRGTNFAVELGRRVASEMLSTARTNARNAPVGQPG